MSACFVCLLDSSASTSVLHLNLLWLGPTTGYSHPENRPASGEWPLPSSGIENQHVSRDTALRAVEDPKTHRVGALEGDRRAFVGESAAISSNKRFSWSTLLVRRLGAARRPLSVSCLSLRVRHENKVLRFRDGMARMTCPICGSLRQRAFFRKRISRGVIHELRVSPAIRL